MKTVPMNRQQLIRILFGILALLLVPDHARADPMRKFQVALTLQQKGKHKLAVRMFREARSLSDQPLFALYQGLSEIALKQYRRGGETIFSQLSRVKLRDGKLSQRLTRTCLGLLALEEKDRPLTAYAILARLKRKEQIPRLLKIATNAKIRDHRLAAIWALGQIGDPAALDGLEKAFRKNPTPALKLAIVRAVSRLITRRSVLAFKEWKEDEALKRAAILGLARLGHSDALAELPLLRNTGPYTLLELARVLKSLSLEQLAAGILVHLVEHAQKIKVSAPADALKLLASMLTPKNKKRPKWAKAWSQKYGKPFDSTTHGQQYPLAVWSHRFKKDGLSGVTIGKKAVWLMHGGTLHSVSYKGRMKKVRKLGVSGVNGLHRLGSRRLLVRGRSSVGELTAPYKKMTLRQGHRLLLLSGTDYWTQNGNQLMRWRDGQSKACCTGTPKLQTALTVGQTLYGSGRLNGHFNVLSLDLTSGRVLWSKRIVREESQNRIYLAPISSSVLVAARGGFRAVLSGITAKTGNGRWHLRPPGLQGRPLIVGPPVIGTNQTIYWPADALYAIDLDGSIKWKSFAFGCRLALVGADGTIYATDGQHVFALNSRGKPLWVARAWDRQATPIRQLVLTPGGLLLAIGNRTISAFRTTSRGLAKTLWPSPDGDSAISRNAIVR